MKSYRPHFRYNKRQRKGVFYLLLLIASLQAFYYYVDSSTSVLDTKKGVLQAFQNQWDSLRKVQMKVFKGYQVNPNFLTDAKGYELGMSVLELDRLFLYRKQQKWIRTLADFQQVTQVSDSLLNVLAPHFRFPVFYSVKKSAKPKVLLRPVIDINSATQEDLLGVRGIGQKLSKRILSYKKLLGGFSTIQQLYEVWGLDSLVVDKLKSLFVVAEIPLIKKIPVNTATFKEVLSIVYLDYKTTKLIFTYKDSVGKIEKLQELKKIVGFPAEKYDRIALYLRAN
jgi:DNA uptake protein ComE-like DNA-binding protein